MLLTIAFVAVIIGQLLFAATKLSEAIGRPRSEEHLNSPQARQSDPMQPARERARSSPPAAERHDTAEAFLLARRR
jgi:hypothetical protein